MLERRRLEPCYIGLFDTDSLEALEFRHSASDGSSLSPAGTLSRKYMSLSYAIVITYTYVDIHAVAETRSSG